MKVTTFQINLGKEGGGGVGWLRGPRCFHNRRSAQNFHLSSDPTAQDLVAQMYQSLVCFEEICPHRVTLTNGHGVTEW